MTAATAATTTSQPTPRRVTHGPTLHQVSTGTLASTGTVQQLCKALGVDRDAMRGWDDLAATRPKLRKGATLFHAGDRSSSLYAIRAAACKTVLSTEDGEEAVAAYYIAGDIIGIDGLCEERHGYRAIALEDTELCAIPFERLRSLACADGTFQHTLHRMLAREISRARKVLMLGKMRAEQRLASFLLEVARRNQALGYSSTEFILRMTREEIGSYLGVTLETVSRLFSRFDQLGIIEVHGRTIKVLDRCPLQRMVSLSALN